MKKTLIAGAASVALAAMPVLGVMATTNTYTTYTDTLNLTLAESCSWSRATTPHNPSIGWTAGQEDQAAIDTFAGTISADALNSAIATSKFHVVCNVAKGYKITVTPDTNLVNTTNTDKKIPFTNSLAKGTAGYGIYYNSALIALDDSQTYKTITESGKQTTGQDYEFTYAVATAADQAAGTYAGSVTYAFAEL